MKQRILQTIVALLTIASGATAQTLSVASVEATTEEQAELVVSASGMTDVTALQFNLQLPVGLTAKADGTSLGTATDGHTLIVENLESGEQLFVLYSMDLKTFKSGELLRIPVTAGDNEVTATGCLFTVRTATADAVSKMCDNCSFDVIIVDNKYMLGDISGDGIVDVSDYIGIANAILGNPPADFNENAADVNGDGIVDVSDYIGVANLILYGNIYGQ